MCLFGAGIYNEIILQIKEYCVHICNLPTCVMRAVSVLIGVAVISSISPSLTETTFGWLDDLIYKEIFGKWYLHLLVNGTEFQTLLLCNSQDEMLEELKVR